MAARKVKEKIGLKDIVVMARAGWTPEETNALLDRLEQIGDVNDPPEAPEDNGDEGEPSEENDDEGDKNEPSEEDGDEGEPSVEDNLDKLKKIGEEVKNENILELKNENDRLKKELQNLQMKNRNEDFSGGSKKSLEDSLIDAFQSCFN